MNGARRGTNKLFSLVQSDVTPIGDTINLGEIDVGLPNCFAGVQFFTDATGTNEAIPTAGSIEVTIQTLASSPRYEPIRPGVIEAVAPSTVSWEANTRRVKAVPTGIDVATHYRLTVTCNENGNTPIPAEIKSQRPDDSEKGIVTRPILPRGAFGALRAESLIPVVQMEGVYGITDKQETFEFLGGTVGVDHGQFTCSSGPNPNGFSAVTSKRQAKYRAGQGLMARFTTQFDTPQANTIQRAGLTNNTDQIGFGCVGLDFGIVFNRGGESEIQELTISTPAGGAENATITIDGTGYTVPLTAGTAQHNAYEIAGSLNAQVPNWDFTSNDNQVVARALLATIFTGSFAFSSSTAIATWFQVNAGHAATTLLIKQEDWNIRTRPDLDPTKGNVYQVQFQYLGYGSFFFSIENPATGELEVVHIIEYGNANTEPSLSNPTFRIGWSASNGTNTTPITIKGASAVMFNEGAVVVTESPRSLSNTQVAVGTTDFINIISFRNRIVFNTKRNRIEIEPFVVTVLTDSPRGAVIEISKSAVPAGDLDFSYVNKAESTAEYAIDNTIITGGDPIVDFVVTTAGSKVELRELGTFLFPGECFSISGRIIAGSASDITATITWIEDQ